MALDEISQVEMLVDLAKKNGGEVSTLCRVPYKNKKFPVYGITIGSSNPKDPTLGLFGGVHGLERVGTQVVVAFLETLLQQMSWDKDLAARMKRVRVVSVPLVNPVGMHLGTRANGNGVDLMRNAPVEGEGIPLLVGGHRLSPKLWWYRGEDSQQLELEVAATTQFVRDQMFSSKAALSLDCHSGFGMQDRLWFPYARTRAPFPLTREARAIEKLLSTTYPNHVYKVEPQSVSYTTHGDFWDLLFDEHQQTFGDRPYIPWTLEMGSWLWVKKNPLQMLQTQGLFNPIKPHRIRRTLRRHLSLLDFFLSAVKNHEVWSNDKKLVAPSRTRARKKTLGRVS